ncbi:MAG: lipase family protein [Sphingobacteriales bacterium]|nr:MAG: lipase family protein [Sphingobacteriales bacterium]
MNQLVHISLFLFFMAATCTANAQKLKAGFDKQEYMELLRLYSRQGDSTFYKDIPRSNKYRRIYRSPVVGLENRWDLCVSKDSVAVISLRGTIDKPMSWLANFYSAMVPAKGQATLADDYTFDYHLADNPRASVHIGWLVCTGFLSRDILPKLDSCYKVGIKDYIILGHSQGGAISYLLTSHFNSLKKQGKIPADVVFKTYCSASPKPGNLYYAYDYEHMTYGGWAYNVVNSADWVPETPVAVQTIYDNNDVNPFSNARATIRKQKFPQNTALSYIYARLKKPSLKANRRNQKILGKMLSKYIKGHLKGYKEPKYYPSSNYVRTGTYIVLLADDAYYKKFPDDKDNIFVHHLLQPYLYLAEQLP